MNARAKLQLMRSTGSWLLVCPCETYTKLSLLVTFTEQAVYNRPQPADKIRTREGRDAIDTYQLVQRLQSMVRSQVIYVPSRMYSNSHLSYSGFGSLSYGVSF